MPPTYTYADLAALTEASGVIVRAQIREQIAVESERSPGLAPGHVRLFIQARTSALIAGTGVLGESLRYLVDVPVDAKGKPPKLKNLEVFLFARTAADRPGELQLLSNSSMIPVTQLDEARLRSVIADFTAPDQPPRILGIRDALSVPGNLAGESETQIFLDAEDGRPVSLSIIRRPGMAPVWGVSWTEIVDQAARPPQEGTVEWYRLACFLPDMLPVRANLTRDRAAYQQAAADYRYVLDTLPPCERTLTDLPL